MNGFVIINPGSGPVERATLEHARKNIRTFVKDLKIKGVKIMRVTSEIPDDGRWSFNLYYKGKKVNVRMPGLPEDQVRFMKLPHQNIWEFPRLFVTGSSWIWCIAIRIALGDFDLNPDRILGSDNAH